VLGTHGWEVGTRPGTAPTTRVASSMRCQGCSRQSRLRRTSLTIGYRMPNDQMIPTGSLAPAQSDDATARDRGRTLAGRGVDSFRQTERHGDHRIELRISLLQATDGSQESPANEYVHTARMKGAERAMRGGLSVPEELPCKSCVRLVSQNSRQKAWKFSPLLPHRPVVCGASGLAKALRGRPKSKVR